MTGQLCPECGTPRTADDRPGCACAVRPGPAAPAARRPSGATAAETTMPLTRVAGPVGPKPSATPRTAPPADTRKADGAARKSARRTESRPSDTQETGEKTAGGAVAGQAVAAGPVAGQAVAGAEVTGDGTAASRTTPETPGTPGTLETPETPKTPGTPEEVTGQITADTAEDGAADTTRARVEGVSADLAEEIAEAEDFNPLRVRPYVTLDAGDDSTEPPPVFRTAGPMPPLAPASDSVAPPPAPFRPAPPPPRRTPYRALAIGAAVLAVIGTAAFAGGLFSGSEPGERALPERTSGLPTVGVLESDASRSPSAPSTPAVTPSSSAPSTAGTSPSPGPGVSTAPSATASREPSAPPSSTAPAGTPSRTKQPPRQPSFAPGGASLGPGDSGPEVVELQNRLAEVWLFRGRPDGRYDERVEGAVTVYQSYRSVEGDPEGVYGPNTRRALEAETQGRGRRH